MVTLIRATADVVHIHAVGRRAEIEMHVDIDSELMRHLEHSIDLAGRVGVGVGRRPDHSTAALQAFDHELVGTRIVEQPLLRKDADFKVDGPGIVLDERQHALEAAQPDDRIDLQMGAHVGGALEDRLLQRARGTRMDILGCESLFRLGNLRDRFFEIAAVGGTAVKDAGLVEMDMRLDKARRDETTAEIDRFALGGQLRLNRDDLAVLDPDVGGAPIGVDQPGALENEVHGVFSLPTSLSRARRDRRGRALDRRAYPRPSPRASPRLTGADRCGPPPKARGWPSDRRAGSSSPVP